MNPSPAATNKSNNTAIAISDSSSDDDGGNEPAPAFNDFGGAGGFDDLGDAPDQDFDASLSNQVPAEDAEQPTAEPDTAAAGSEHGSSPSASAARYSAQQKGKGPAVPAFAPPSDTSDDEPAPLQPMSDLDEGDEENQEVPAASASTKKSAKGKKSPKAKSKPAGGGAAKERAPSKKRKWDSPEPEGTPYVLAVIQLLTLFIRCTQVLSTTYRAARVLAKRAGDLRAPAVWTATSLRHEGHRSNP